MLLDFLFPKTCLSCNAFGSYICASCQKRLQWSEEPFRFEEVSGISILKYDEVTRRIIKKLKYRFLFDAFEELFKIITPRVLDKCSFLKSLSGDTCFQAVPLHPQREKWRGFNQSIFIARYLQTIYSYPLINALERKRYTAPQASERSRDARRVNLEGAFVLKEEALVKGKTVILVDDVITTGYTLKECIKTLKKADVASVYAFTLAQRL